METTRPGQATVEAKPWGFDDPKMERRKRIAKHKVYIVETTVVSGSVNQANISGGGGVKDQTSPIQCAAAAKYLVRQTQRRRRRRSLSAEI